MAPCPGASFIGTPVIACASAGLNIEQGSISAFGDCGCVSLLAEDADVGVGVAELELPVFEDELLHEMESMGHISARKHKTFFIKGLRNKFQIVMNRMADLLCFPAHVA
jgi:hypothetical protein